MCVSPNAEKKNQMFTPEEKLLLVRTAVEDLPNVEAELWPGLLADFAVDHGATAIVRGVRNTSDFDVEYQMALINQKLCPEVNTVFLNCRAENMYLSSSIVRQIAGFRGDISDFVPAQILGDVAERLIPPEKEEN